MTELADRLDVLGWKPTDPRAPYDRAVFLLLEELVREVERLERELGALRRTLDARTESLA